MANTKNNSATQETRRKLLQAAGEVFADRGFHAATIKQITDRAGASLASVNYHFQDKAELYAAVLRRIAEEVAEVIPPDDQMSGDATARFRQFIHYFCSRLMGREKPAWEQVLMAREMAEPTAALEPLYKQVVGPLSEKLSALIAELLRASPSDPAVGLAAASVLGQCVYYMRHRRLFSRMHPQMDVPPSVEQLAGHITAFSLAGIRAARDRRGREG
ncbi:MAG TPA: CerR family C-terminal domain-containing protein [Tepidisphaeraceae bacterium]|jgi:AcrR family transcriptional regulator|nr:CerR family C-terminal domain-containing protein [Tepidisphaeraceae bacterium]